VVHRATAVPAAGAAAGAGAAADAPDDRAVVGEDPEAAGVSCRPHPERATVTVAVSTAVRAPRRAILRVIPMTSSFDGPVPYRRRTGSAG
jgi:hypothetical protein